MGSADQVWKRSGDLPGSRLLPHAGGTGTGSRHTRRSVRLENGTGGTLPYSRATGAATRRSSRFRGDRPHPENKCDAVSPVAVAHIVRHLYIIWPEPHLHRCPVVNAGSGKLQGPDDHGAVFDDPFENVHRADEPGDKFSRRLFIDLCGRAGSVRVDPLKTRESDSTLPWPLPDHASRTGW